MVRARSRPVSSCGGGEASVIGSHLTTRHRVATASQNLGYVVADRGRDQHLLRRTDRGGQPLPPGRVEFGEDIVEHQDRLYAVGSEQRETAQLQRQGKRPRFAMAGVAPRGKHAEGERDVVSMWANQ